MTGKNSTPHLYIVNGNGPASCGGFDGLARRVGMSNALALVDKVGGVTLRVPMGCRRQSLERLVARLGDAGLAKQLVRHYGGTSLYIPTRSLSKRLERNQAMHLAAEAGLRQGRSMCSIVAGLAVEYGLSDRQVWSVMGVASDG